MQRGWQMVKKKLQAVMNRLSFNDVIIVENQHIAAITQDTLV